MKGDRHLVGLLSALTMLAAAGCGEDTRISVYEFLEMDESAGAAPGFYPTTQPATQPAEAPPEPWSPGPYRVGPGDVIEVNIAGLEAIGVPGTHQVRVSTRGEVTLPTAGKVQVGGLTLDEAEAKIRDAYTPKYVRDARVRVRLAESTLGIPMYQPVSVIVMGEVVTPATVQLRRDQASVLQAILAAGGPTGDSGGLVTHIPAENPAAQTVFNLDNRQDLIRSARLGALQQSDVVIVERARHDFVYVEGLVNQPGPVPMPNGSQLSVIQAIGAAGGTLLTFAPSEGTLTRRRANGQAIRVRLDLDKMKAGEDPDLALRPGDVVTVPHTLETRLEEFLARTFIFRFGMDTTYNPWTDYYFREDFDLRERQLDAGGGVFNTFGRALTSQDLTPLLPTPVSPVP